MTPGEVIASARELLGTPFRHMGRTPGYALDCAGVAVVVARHWYEVIEPRAYGRRPHDDLLRAWLLRQPYLVPCEPRAGAVLLMRFRVEPQHLAIHTGPGLIHAYESTGRVVEHDFDARWASRIVAAWRFADMSDE